LIAGEKKREKNQLFKILVYGTVKQ